MVKVVVGRARRPLLNDLQVVRTGNPTAVGYGTSSNVVTARSTVGYSFDAAGNFITSGVNVPRYNSLAGGNARLLQEEQRINLVRNARFEGASGATSPTNMGHGGGSAAGLGITMTQVSENGCPCLDIRYQGTASGTSFTFNFETTTGIPAGNSETYAYSAYAVVSPGTVWPSGVTYRLSMTALDSGAANLGTVVGPVIVTPALGLIRSGRVTGTGTTPAALVTNLRPAYSINGLVVSNVYDFTIRIAVPQVELGSFVLSPILPPVGVPGASTRGVDYSTLPVTASAARAYVFRGMVIAQHPTSFQGIMAFDDQTFNNRLYIFNPNASTAVNFQVANAGVYVGPFNMGTLTYGVEFTLAVTWDANEVRWSFNGGAVGSVTTPVPVNLFNLFYPGLVGVGGIASLNGEIAAITGYRFKFTDGQLIAASTQ